MKPRVALLLLLIILQGQPGKMQGNGIAVLRCFAGLRVTPVFQ